MVQMPASAHLSQLRQHLQLPLRPPVPAKTQLRRLYRHMSARAAAFEFDIVPESDKVSQLCCVVAAVICALLATILPSADAPARKR